MLHPHDPHHFLERPVLVHVQPPDGRHLGVPLKGRRALPLLPVQDDGQALAIHGGVVWRHHCGTVGAQSPVRTSRPPDCGPWEGGSLGPCDAESIGTRWALGTGRRSSVLVCSADGSWFVQAKSDARWELACEPGCRARGKAGGNLWGRCSAAAA